MANEVINKNEIALNGYRFRTRSPVVGSFIDPFPGQFSIGGDSYNNRLELSDYQIKAPLYIGNENNGLLANYCWWTNCITDIHGHILPPRLATAISTFPTFTNNTYYSPQSVGDNASDWSNEANAIDGNTATYAQTKDAAGSTWSDYLIVAISGISCSKIRYWWDESAAITDDLEIDVYYNGAWNNVVNSLGAQGQYVEASLGATYTVTAARIKFHWNGSSANQSRLHDIQFYTEATALQGSIGKFANFNGFLFLAYGNTLLQMSAGRSAFTIITAVPTTIVDLIPSLNSKLYIYVGDTEKYWYMNTSEASFMSNSANAYWGWQSDNKLFKCNTSGTVAYSTDPDGASPTWTSGGSITDIASQIQGFIPNGRDASGNIVPYCATKSKVKVYDSATPAWLDTEVNLGDHPNGGKGHTYFNGKSYFSYGLGMKEYYPENGSLIDVGLTEMDGLPAEYNGEIVKLYGDTGVKLMFIAVDASQVSGTAQSGLYIFDGIGLRCWWVDTNNDAAMGDIIVSSAQSANAVYWVCGSSVYYIDIPRGIQNPDKITQSYATSGIFLSPWFDAGDQSSLKLAKYLEDFAKGVTTTETIALKYRIDKTNTDRDTGWTTLETLNTTGEDGYNQEIFASGAGLSYRSIQYRLDFVTGGSTAKADLQSLKMFFKKRVGGSKIRRWSVDVLLDSYSAGAKGNETPKAKITNIKTAIESATDVVFCYRRNANADEAYYVSVHCDHFEEVAGPDYEGNFATLILTEV